MYKDLYHPAVKKDLKKIDRKDLSRILGEGVAKKVKEAIGQKN